MGQVASPTPELTTSVAAPADPEWWERVRDRSARWTAAHPVLVGRVRLMWLVVCLVGLVVFGVEAVLSPNVRAAAAVYVGVAWILLCWWALARTRTLTLRGLTLLYGVCVPWSLGIGLLSLHLSALMPASWPLHGPGTLGPSVGIAALTEEAFKLLPVAVLVVAAPGRVRRFVAVDWLLVGLASGAGFLTSEEVQRRLGILRPGSRGLLDFCAGGSMGERIDCYGLTTFGLNPFGAKRAVVGLFGVETNGAQYAGHHVLTALVTVGVGLGVVLWRSAPARATRAARVGRRVGAVVLPLVLLWVAVADHVVLNAEAFTGGIVGTGGPWLQAGSTIPAPFRLWWYVGGHGHGRTGLLLVLLAAALLCDATRARRQGYWSIVPLPGSVWADQVSGWCQTRLGGAEANGPARWIRDSVTALTISVVSLVYVVGRDMRLTLAAHARQPGESRRDAMLRGRAALLMVREAREIAADVDAGPGGRHRYRMLAVVAAGFLLVLGLVAGPALARSIGWDQTFSVRWLAGLAENLGKWWNTLSPAQQLALTVLAGLALAIPFGFAWGLFLAGGLTYLAAHGRGLSSLIRNPRQTTQDYLTHRSPAGMALDAGEFALTFIPAGFGSAGGLVAKGPLRAEVARYLDDPAAWRAGVKKALLAGKDHRGTATADFATGLWIVNGLRPRAYVMAGKVWRGEAVGKLKAWPDAVREAYPDGVRFTKEGFPDFGPNARVRAWLEQGFSGNRGLDDLAANLDAGMPSTPDGWTWHHVEDKHTMQLVPTDLHSHVPHTGGHAVAKPPKVKR